jgi:hypothetical protein
MPLIQGRIPDRKRVAQLRKIYGISEKVLKNETLSIGLENYSIQLSNKIKRNSEIEVQQLNVRAMKWAKVAMPESYNQSRALGTSKLVNAGEKRDPRFKEETHQRAKDNGIEVTQKGLLRANRSIMPQINLYLKILGDAHKAIVRADIQELDVFDQAVVNQIISTGLEMRLTLPEISRNVGSYLRQQFKVGRFINRNGRNYNMRHYAEMVARTQMRFMQTVATINTAKEFGNDLVIWSAHPHEADVCSPFQGNIYSRSGKSKRYSKLDEVPPLHPNCEHYLDPYPDVLEDSA